MFLLKNEAEFNEWKENNIFDDDEADMPDEFPCFVSKEVIDWRYETEKAVYFYKSTLQSMIKELEG